MKEQLDSMQIKTHLKKNTKENHQSIQDQNELNEQYQSIKVNQEDLEINHSACSLGDMLNEKNLENNQQNNNQPTCSKKDQPQEKSEYQYEFDVKQEENNKKKDNILKKEIQKKKKDVNLSSIYKKIFKMHRSQNQKKRMLQREQYEQEQQCQYRQDYGCVASRRILTSESTGGAYYLCGGVTIETADTQRSKEGSAVLNHFVQVLGTEVFEERGVVEVKLQNAQKGLTEFAFLSELTNSYENIQNYNTFVQNLLKKKQACEQVEGFNQFSEIVSNKQDDFHSFFQSTIEQLINSGQKIFSYRIYKFDLFDFEFKLKSHGYSEDFVKTLGYSSLNQFRDLVMHRGLPEIFTQSTRQRLAVAHMVQIAQKQRVLSEINCRLLALDGIEIDTSLGMRLIPFYDSHTPIYNSLFDCSAMLEISTYNITNSTLREVINIRREINFDVNDALKQDIYYELQSQLFVDKFYSYLPLKVKKQISLHSNSSINQTMNQLNSRSISTSLIEEKDKRNVQSEGSQRKLSSPLHSASDATSCQQFDGEEEDSFLLHHPHLEKVSSQHSTRSIKIEQPKICGFRKI